jgi:voltage-gated potassium channel
MRRIISACANNGRWLFVLIVGSWLIASALFGLIEGKSVVDSLYWAMTTMSTVGYGDLSPATTLGKFVTIAFQAWSIFMLVPCAVAHVIDKIRRDEHKFTHAEQEWQEDTLSAIAESLGVGVAPQVDDHDTH